MQKDSRIAISKRLMMNCAMVPKCRTFADIGCDHAYSSIYLAISGVAGKCIAMDVVEGPLARAKENIAKYGLEDKIEVRQSDGLSQLAEKEAEVIMISGMGGPLMLDILKCGIHRVREANVLILQPQSELVLFRKGLKELTLSLSDEDMCCEDGKYYTAMYVENRVKQEEAKQEIKVSQQIAAKYGLCLIEKRHPILAEYIDREIEKKKQIEEKLSEQQTARGIERLLALRTELAELAKLQRFLKTVNG